MNIGLSNIPTFEDHGDQTTGPSTSTQKTGGAPSRKIHSYNWTCEGTYLRRIGKSLQSNTRY